MNTNDNNKNEIEYQLNKNIRDITSLIEMDIPINEFYEYSKKISVKKSPFHIISTLSLGVTEYNMREYFLNPLFTLFDYLGKKDSDITTRIGSRIFYNLYFRDENATFAERRAVTTEFLRICESRKMNKIV